MQNTVIERRVVYLSHAISGGVGGWGGKYEGRDFPGLGAGVCLVCEIRIAQGFLFCHLNGCRRSVSFRLTLERKERKCE